MRHVDTRPVTCSECGSTDVVKVENLNAPFHIAMYQCNHCGHKKHVENITESNMQSTSWYIEHDNKQF